MISAQTRVDLGRQSRNVDFSQAVSTKSLKAGTSLPATCSISELFFRLNAPAGSNLYGCTATNTWALQAGGGAVALQAAYGISITNSATATAVGVDTAVVPTFLTYSATLSYPSLTQGQCGEQSMNAPGAAVGDGVMAGWPVNLAANLVGMARVSAPGVVVFRVCNTGSTASGSFGDSFRATIVRSF